MENEKWRERSPPNPPNTAARSQFFFDFTKNGDILGWAYLGNRKFTRGCVNLVFRGEKLPVHIDLLASVSHLVANLASLDAEMADIVIPDTLEHNGLDLFLTHIVYRDWYAAVPLKDMTFLDAILCTGVMAFFDAPDHAFGDIDATIGRRLQRVVCDRSDFYDVVAPLYACVSIPHCRACSRSSCVARYAVPKPGTTAWDALVKNRSFVPSYMPTTWNLIRHARSLVPSRDDLMPQLVARYPEAIELLTSYRSTIFTSKTSAFAELRRRRKLGRPLMANVLPVPYDAQAFQAILEADNLVMLAKCCAGETLDELEALFREIKGHVVEPAPNTLGINLGGEVFNKEGHLVAGRGDVVRVITSSTHWYAHKVIDIPAFPFVLGPLSYQNMYFVVPETVGLERVMSWRTRFLAIFCALTPPLEEFAV